MVASGLSVLLSALALLPHASFAVVVTHEDAGLMRRETQQLELTPDAAVQRHKPSELVKTQPKRAADNVDLQNLIYCDDDYVVGKPDSDDCADPTADDGDQTYTKIDDSQCMLAGTESGARTDHDLFRIPNSGNFRNIHPKGCFKFPCGKHVANSPANDVCYFFNEIEQTPSGVAAGTMKGQPICRRKRWLNGTQNSAAEDGGCPAGYKVVATEAVCREAGRCQMKTDAVDFLVGIKNASQHLDHPKGCFYDQTLKEVFFNDPAFFTAALPADSVVHGTPMCIVKTVTTWAEAATADERAAHDAAADKTAGDKTAADKTDADKTAADKTAADTTAADTTAADKKTM